MKQTKLILTRTALTLFVMLLTQGAWALQPTPAGSEENPHKLHLGDDKVRVTLSVGTEGEDGYQAVELGKNDNGLANNKSLKLTYTGAELTPTIIVERKLGEGDKAVWRDVTSHLTITRSKNQFTARHYHGPTGDINNSDYATFTISITAEKFKLINHENKEEWYQFEEKNEGHDPQPGTIYKYFIIDPAAAPTFAPASVYTETNPRIYNGEALAATEVTISGLPEGHTTNAVPSFSGDDENLKNAGDYTISLAAPQGEELAIFLGDVDVTDCFESLATSTGTITINPKSVTVQANNGEVVAGEEFEPTATVTGLIDNGGTITYSMSCDYDPSATEFESTYEINVSGEENQGNYTVSYSETPGTLTVTNPVIPVTVTITGHQGGYEYNNEEHVISGYDVEISDSQYTEDDFTFSGTAEVKATAAGVYFMGLTKDDFENTNTKFDVTFDVTDGYMTIDYHIAALADNADNTATITSIVEHNFCTADVTLAGRTLYKDGAWNTICLPFDVTIAGSPLAGADVCELSSASFADGELNLEFTAVTAIKAGVPYIIKWASGSNISNPTFNAMVFSTELKDKAIDLGDGKSVIFKGTYAPVAYAETNKSVLLVGAGSTLYYPEAGAYTNAQRAYFQLEGLEVGTVESNAIGLRFGDATGIINVLTPAADAVYYDLSGRCIKGQPTETGIYIVNGKKVVIK